ncbi:PASTA domain-containing protein [Actinocorallia libanotica]|uniref:PASTA domain-containing protein n=1 Tax=Actinocorallia libanotica TaxID=46162 RepID=A0ABP4AWU8_9ACTN
MPAENQPDSPVPESAVPPPATAPEALPEPAEPAEEPAAPMSLRSMVLLGGLMSAGVALILGLTLLVGGVPSSGPGGRPDTAGTVPSLTGRSLPEATAALADRRLAIGSVVRVPSSLSPGEVVRTTPEAGSPAPEGTTVTLYVSGGTGDERSHAEVTVPYLLGVEGRRAQQVARQLGLNLELPAAAGRVLTQRPAPGTEVASGTTLTVTLG